MNEKPREQSKQAQAQKDENPEASPSETGTAPAPSTAPPETPTSIPPLRLPRGGFIAVRERGGEAAVSREAVIYPDGRVAYDARGVPQRDYNRLPRVLNDGQILALRHLLGQTGFWRTSTAGEPVRGANTFEIAARLGHRSNVVQVDAGSIPGALAPLVERLTQILPEAQT